MLFNSGDLGLLEATRLFAGDPSTAANPRIADAEWKQLINQEYLMLRDLLRLPGVGWTRKRAYADGVAVDTPDDHFYELPADFVGRLRVEISTNGSNLSTTLPGSSPSIKVLSPVAYDVALDHYNIDSGGTSDIKYVFMHDQHFGISTPLTSTEAGTKSIRITYEASSTALSNDNDEPDLPRPYHIVIAMGAALLGGVADNLEVRDLERRYELSKNRLQQSAWDQIADHDSQMTVAGRVPTTRYTNIGRVKRK